MNNKRWQLVLCLVAGALTGVGFTTAVSGGFHVDSAHPVQAALLATVIVLVGLLVFQKLIRAAINFVVNETGINTLLPAFAPAGRQTGLAEEEAFAKLVTELRDGPARSNAGKPQSSSIYASTTAAEPAVESPEKKAARLHEFFAWAPERVAQMKSLMAKCGREESASSLREILVDINDQAALLKNRADLPELRPVWQLTTTLEGLLKQLTGRVSNITHSTLRTVAGGVDLLAELCAPGVRPDLAANPPIRILAVDDDMVSRQALRASIIRVFDAPDLAENGAEALGMVKVQRYDLVILDVMMPGMDGFEVCSRIRQAAINSTTPILFVTALKDFDSRTPFLTTGGNDILGKPFLIFEIALKSLTLVLRGRLRDRHLMMEAAGRSGTLGNPAVAWPSASVATAKEQKTAPKAESSRTSGFDTERTLAGGPAALPPPVFAAKSQSAAAAARSSAPETREPSKDFLTYAASKVSEMKNQLTVIAGMEENQVKRDLVTRLHLTLRSLARKLDVPEMRPAFELCSAMEGLSKKFDENAKNVTESALRTATAGVELLGELCVPGLKADMATNPPIRLLVVDDEPLARRAVTGALQMSFSRPDAVECGESALALAAEKAFDLVFLDICMPDMDGFTVCSRIRETELNRSTPVVFVTSYSDDSFRAQADRCGGNDYVVKPFAFAEVTVKALTFALRSRLDKFKNSQPAAHSAPAPSPADSGKKA